MGWRAEVPHLLRLAGPMMVVQGGLMTMGMVDTFVVGRVSPLEMGAVALGNTVVSIIVVFGIGLALGLEPLAAQAHGAGERERARHWLVQGMWLTGLAAIPLAIGSAIAALYLSKLGVSEALAERAGQYIYARIPGILANGLFVAYRAYLTSVGRTRPILIAVIAANLLNLGLDWYLVMALGLGAWGVGVATSIAWFFMLGFVALATRDSSLPAIPRRFEKRDVGTVFGLGWPIGLHLVVEVGIFALVSVFIARLGEVPLAGHNIAIMLASLTFMAAVGLAVASTARVGAYVGAGDSASARRTGFLSIGLGAVFMGSCGAIFWLYAEPITRLFAPGQPEVIRVGASLLRIAAVFSVCDGIQCVAAGALRGVGDTKWPFYANLAAHWLVGLPVALFLGFHLGMSSQGFWWGLTVGLTGTAITLLIRFHVASKGQIARVDSGSHEVAA